jgi:mannose-6-phosphate isomerase-like protein (cupin superfamily)
MNTITLRDALPTVRPLEASAVTSSDEAMDAMKVLGDFNRCMLGLARFQGLTPWELHPDDELLHVLEGSVEVEILPAEGASERSTLTAGDVLIVPRALWHRQRAIDGVALLFVTSREGNDVSSADDPRSSREGKNTI